YESTAFLPEAVHDKMDVFISKMETTIDDKITLVLENAFHVSEFVILIATVPVLVFYFLKDRYMILRWLNSLLPKKWREKYRSEEHTSELQSRFDLVCRLLLEKKKKQ